MSNEQELTDKDLMLTPGKIMFFSWLNNLFQKKQATFKKDNNNIVLLNSYPSTWFCIGRNNEDKSPFIGIQEHMIPWFFETPWKNSIIVENDNMLYLTCGDKETSDFTLGIKIRKKRFNVLWGKETQRHLDFRIIKINSQDEISISEKVYKRIPLEKLDDINLEIKPTIIKEVTKSELYEEEIKSRFKDKFGNLNN